MSHEALSNLEHGYQAPKTGAVQRLTLALGISPDDLVADTPVRGLTKVTITEAAADLGVPRERLRLRVMDGILPGKKVSQARRISRIAVVELERSGRLRGMSRRLDPRYPGNRARSASHSRLSHIPANQ